MKLTNILPALLLLSVNTAVGETSHHFLRRLEESSDSVDDCGRPTDCPEEFCVGPGNKFKRCAENGGFCSDAVFTFLSGDPTDTDVATRASALLKYGKYCGRDNRCSGLEGCDDPPSPCDDAVDKACMAHDNCLDTAIKEFEEEEEKCFDGVENNIPEVDRLSCDAHFVATLAGIATTAIVSGSGPTFLCDKDYYEIDVNGNLVADLLGHESVLMAAPFCTTTITWCQSIGLDLVGGNHPVPDCLVAGPFCTELSGKLALLL